MASSTGAPIAAVLHVSLPAFGDPLWTFKLWDGSLKVSHQHELWSDLEFQVFVITMMTSIAPGFTFLQSEVPQAHVQHPETFTHAAAPPGRDSPTRVAVHLQSLPSAGMQNQVAPSSTFQLEQDPLTTTPNGQTLLHPAISQDQTADSEYMVGMDPANPYGLALESAFAIAPVPADPTDMSVYQGFDSAMPNGQAAEVGCMMGVESNNSHGSAMEPTNAKPDLVEDTMTWWPIAPVLAPTDVSGNQEFFDFAMPNSQAMEADHMVDKGPNKPLELSLESAFATPNPSEQHVSLSPSASNPDSPLPASQDGQDPDEEAGLSSSVTEGTPKTPSPENDHQHYSPVSSLQPSTPPISSLQPSTPKRRQRSPRCPGAPMRRPAVFLTQTDADVRRSLKSAAKRGLHWRSTMGR